MAGFLNNSSCGFAKVAVQLCNVNKPFFTKTNSVNIDEILDQNTTTEEKYARYLAFFEERDDNREQNVTGQNVTGQNVTRTKCHKTKCHPDKMLQDKMSTGQNVTGQNVTGTKLCILKDEEFLTSN